MRIPYSVTYSGDLRIINNLNPYVKKFVVVGFKCTHIQYYIMMKIHRKDMAATHL